MLNPSSFSNDAKADMNAGRGNGNGKRQKQHGQGAQKKDQHLRAEQGTTQHEDYTPPMRNAVDATHNIPGSNQDSNKNPGARGEAPGAKASRPRRKKPRSKKAVAHASAQNTSPAAQSVLSASGETSHPARNHTIEAIMVLAQTLLAPHQMLELIKRLSSAMPANAAKPPFSIHPAAKHQDPQVSLDVSDAPGSTKQQGPRGEDAVRSRRGRGPSWNRGGRGRGAWSRGRGGRGAGSL